MRKFLIRILFFIIPFIAILIYYIIADPFMVVRKYDNYFPEESYKNCNNDAYRGICLMDLYQDSITYNSFIVGSSRSDFYYVEEWKKHIGQDANCFHFNQSGDNLRGSYDRIRYLYNRFENIDNLLWIIDADFLEDITNKKGHLFIAPYQATEKWDYISFHYEFFKTFLTSEFQESYIKDILGYKEDTNTLPYYYLPISNELHKEAADSMIQTNLEEYYSLLPKDYQLYTRDSIKFVNKPVIKEEQKKMLCEIKSLIDKSQTNCKIVISPLYDQIKFNPDDLIILQEIFGTNNVYDFSGINEFTNNPLNYYENSHYRPILCDQILSIIYKDRTQQ